MVGVRGFEPPAPASRRQCSTRLSYTPTPERRSYSVKLSRDQRQKCAAGLAGQFLPFGRDFLGRKTAPLLTIQVFQGFGELAGFLLGLARWSLVELRNSR